MALSKIVSSSLANGSVSIASITDNTVTSVKLTATGVVANSYGNTTAIPVITVDAQGRITNATTSSVSGVTGLSFAPANSTITVSTSTTNFDAVVTSGNSTVQGLLTVIDSVSNTSTAIAASANSVTTAYQLAANAVSNATAYAATAYSNAVSVAASDATTKAGTAYSNAISYANTAAGTAYSNAVATAASDATTKAGTAYSNATTYAATIAGTAYSNAVSVAASDATTKAGTAYSNAISYANTAAGTAYSNAISYANTVAYTAAGTAYTNAIAIAASDATTKANAAYSNVFNGGTFSGAVTVQANLTANSVRMNGDLQIDGNLTVSGNTITLNVTNLNVDDNMIYLNSNSTVSHPDLGFAGNYNDGSYKHAGLFRDATDGVWKFFHGYTPEPDASAFIDTANTSFALSNVQINYVIGNVTGSANSATYLGGNTASTLRTYSDTIAGTAYSNATTYAATIAGTAYSNAVSVAASDATTKAGTAYSNATTYAATIAGTAYSNATTYAATIAGTAYSNATTYAATIAGTAYSNAVSVAASDATTKAGTAYSNATTYAATIAGTAYSNAVSVAASDATTKAGTAYSNATTYAATIAGTAYSNATTYAATIAGTAYSNAIAFAANASNISSGTLSASRLPATYLTAESDTLATVTGRGSTTNGAITISSGTTDQGLTMTVSDAGWNYIGFSHGATRKAYFGLDGSGNPQWGSDSGTFSITGNYTTIGTSARSPIFYDSDNTSYYVDPNSTTTAAILAGSVGVGATSPVNSAWGTAAETKQVTIYGSNYGVLNIRGDLATAAHYSLGVGGTRYYAAYDNVAAVHRMVFFGSFTGFNNITTPEYNIHLSGTGYATADWRAPIFYDSADTGYYVNPNGTSNLVGLTVANTISGSITGTAGAVSWSNVASGTRNDYNLGFQAPSSGYAGLYFLTSAGIGAGYFLVRGTSDSFPPYTAEGITLVSDANSLNLFARGTTTVAGGNAWVRMGTGSSETFRLMGDYSYSLNSSRAPIFYDSDDTAYYANPNSTSSMWNVNIRGDASSTNTSNQIFFWGNGSSTTSAIGFKANGGNFSSPTGQGDGYNTYLTMDTAGRGWVFRQGTGGTDFTSLNNSGWILNNGIWQANASMRSPIFYDSDNTAFYINPDAGGSNGSAGTSAYLRGKIEFYDYDGVQTSGARIYYGDRGTQSTQLNAATAINYGVDGFGLCLESGYAGDSGFIKLTDDGIFMSGAADEYLLILWDEDAQATRLYITDGGDAVFSGNITAYSDSRLKTNIEVIPNALDKVKKIRGVTFERLDEKERYSGRRHAGVIAQEVEEVLPEVIDENKEGIKNVAYGNMVGLLIEAIKEQQKLIETLAEKVKVLESK